VIANVGDKVRCIDPKDGIVKGGIYKVEEVYTGSGGDYMYQLVGNGKGYYAHRFEIVYDTKTHTPTPVSTPNVKAVNPIQDDTLSFFKKVGQGMCACNMPKDQCEYHKGS